MPALVHGLGRVAAGERRPPSAALPASQSVVTTGKGGAVGTMPANREGRKRHLLVEPPGLIPAVVVTAANVQDSDGARQLLEGIRPTFSRLRHIGADGAYAEPVVDRVKALRPQQPLRLGITKRSGAIKGLVVIPKLWIVERTFRWLNRYRRPSKDNELFPEASETLIQGTMIHLMMRRLAKIAPY
jgi:putative transposase